MGTGRVCARSELRTPSGEILDLTGTWLGDSGTYWTFAQVGDCIWATALDHYLLPPDSHDFYWQWFIRGTLHPDYTVSVDFAVSQLVANNAVRAEPGYGHTNIAIEFDEVSGAAASLRREANRCDFAGGGPCQGEIALQTSTWALVSPTVILPPPTPGP